MLMHTRDGVQAAFDNDPRVAHRFDPRVAADLVPRRRMALWTATVAWRRVRRPTSRCSHRVVRNVGGRADTPLTRRQPTTGPPSLFPSAGGGLLQGRGRTLAKQQLVGESGDQGPRYRRHEEQPQLVEAGVTGKQCWSGGPGRVHRRVSDRDADEVDEVSAPGQSQWPRSPWVRGCRWRRTQWWRRR